MYFQDWRKDSTDQRSLVVWLAQGRLLSQTSGIVVAAQDGVTMTRAYRERVLREDIQATCLHCGAERETLGHVLAACESHEFSLYKECHDRVIYQLAPALVQSLGEGIPECLHRRGGTCGAWWWDCPETVSSSIGSCLRYGK